MDIELQKKQQKSTKLRWIIMFPFPFQGHLNPMLYLANLLHSKGFSIHIIHTHYRSPDPSLFPHLSFHFIEDGFSFSSDKIPSPCSASLPLVSSLNANCLQPFRLCLSAILSSNVVASSCCLIADPMWGFAVSVADTFNLPRIALRTGSLSAFVVYDSIPLLKNKGYYPLQEAKLDDPVPELPFVKVKDLPPEPMHDLLSSITKETRTSQCIISNTFDALESHALAIVAKTLPIPVFPIGPLHLHKHSKSTSKNSLSVQDKAIIAWLNTQAPKSVLYVSFGSLAAVNEVEFQEIAWGLASSKQPFLWVVRPDLVQGLDPSNPLALPEGYLDAVNGRGRIVKWAPQEEVLGHPSVGGFWTHCGWNSTVESICQGVPMICQPFFGDQAVNARLVSDNWRIGLQLRDPLKREEIQEVIKRLMVEQEGEEMRNKVAALKEKATLSLKEGGSSYQSLDALTSYLLSL